MPAYNEEGCIENVCNKWITHLSKIVPDLRMIVVDDGSIDKTGVILSKLAKKEKRLEVIHQLNGGHGKAILAGYKRALSYEPEWIFNVDSDDQFRPEDFKKLWDQRNTADFLLAVRKNRNDPIHRLIISRLVQYLIVLFFGVKVVDSNIPFRLIRASYLKELLTKLPKSVFAPNIFLSLLASRDGKLLDAIPVLHKPRKTGKVSIINWKLIKICIRSGVELMRFRINYGHK